MKYLLIFLIGILSSISNGAEVKLTKHTVALNENNGKYEDVYKDLGIVTKVTFSSPKILSLSYICQQEGSSGVCDCLIDMGSNTAATLFKEKLAQGESHIQLLSDYWGEGADCTFGSVLCRPSSASDASPFIPKRFVMVKDLSNHQMQSVNDFIR